MRIVLSVESELCKNEITDQKSGSFHSAPSWQTMAKLFLDKCIAVSALIILSPLLIIVCLLIRLDSKGAIIFRQKRNGLHNREFFIWKFRTMRVMESGHNAKQAQKNDSRITRVGNFLRKTSIDELPQLINILIGDMSIVGPRPHPVALNKKFTRLIDDYNKRTLVRPGLTGLAQINGYRGPTNTVEQMQKRIDSDLEYTKKWSIWLDLKIIILTPYYGLFNKNAF